MLGPDDLVITGSTLGHPPFNALVEAAVAGGFSGVSIWPGQTYQAARAEGRADVDMRAVLDHHGVVVEDVDALLVWTGPGGPGERDMAQREAELFEAGQALRAHYVNVAFIGDEAISVEQGAEIFAGVFDRALERGLIAHLEFIPFMAVRDAATALQIVEAANRPAAGILIDTWHCFRGPTTDDDLRSIPGDRVLGVQVNDAPSQPMDDLSEETMHHRLVPGEGDIDIVGFIRILDQIGSRAPLTVEVFSDALLAEHSPFDLAKRLGNAMRDIRARARDQDHA